MVKEMATKQDGKQEKLVRLTLERRLDAEGGSSGGIEFEMKARRIEGRLGWKTLVENRWRVWNAMIMSECCFKRTLATCAEDVTVQNGCTVKRVGPVSSPGSSSYTAEI
jgi:hypothetical protein